MMPFLATCHEKIKNWLKSQIEPVPDHSAVCEFVCRETSCSEERWRSCENRLAGLSPRTMPRGTRRQQRRKKAVSALSKRQRL